MNDGATSRMGALLFLFSGLIACTVDPASRTSPEDAENAARLSPSSPICFGGNWCLVKCSGSGETLHVVYAEPERGFAHCLFVADVWCIRNDLGRRTFACWGTPH